MKKILGVITARGGSKGIPGKNIKDFGGKPLIVYTIEVAQKSELITDFIVSTDDQEIAEVAKQYGAEVPFIRPAELAKDDTPTLPVIQHAVQYMEAQRGYHYDYIVTLQPTSPFRTPQDIDRAIQLIDTEQADSAVSMVAVPSTFHPIKMKKLDGTKVLPYCMPEPEGSRRQDFPKVYRRSSSVYVSRRDLVINDNLFFGEKVVGYEVPIESFADIDTQQDWDEAEKKILKMST